MPLDPRIPHVTDILGIRFTAEENPRLLASEHLRGCCIHSQGRIEIDPLNCPDQQCETYLHEVLHAVAYAVEVEIKEDEIARLARGLFQVLRANKLAFAEQEQQKKQQYCPCCTRPLAECRCTQVAEETKGWFKE